MNAFIRNQFLLVIVVAMAMAASGCVVARRTTKHYTYDAAKGYGVVEYTFHDIQSDAEDEDERAEEFGAVIGMWKEEATLAFWASKKMYVKQRSLAVENGMLVGRMTALFESYGDVSIEQARNGELQTEWMPTKGLMVPEGLVVRSNGRTETKGDSVRVRWPAGTKVLEIEETVSVANTSVDFLKRFREWSHRQ